MARFLPDPWVNRLSLPSRQAFGSYLDLAAQYTRPSHPRLLITHGVSGSGETYGTQQLVEATGAVRLRSDVERKRLFGLAPLERSTGRNALTLYAPEVTQRTYEQLAQQAALVIQAGCTAIVDATFLTRTHRDAFQRLAAQFGVPFTCGPPVACWSRALSRGCRCGHALGRRRTSVSYSRGSLRTCVVGGTPTMPPILLAHMPHGPVSHQPMELVERKGLGHPDSICDAMMEAIAVALSQAYIEMAGHVLHHNLDKGLLVAGQTSPALGGGTVDTPMRLIVGDRATTAWRGQPISVREIAEATAKRWLTEHIRFVDPDRHVVFQHELQPGAPELVDLFTREHLGANDTSAAVGYAPLTETERCVLAAERWLNGPACKARFPEAGEDVKVMGYRQGRQLTLTIALAFVDHFIPNARTYFEQKAAIKDALLDVLAADLQAVDRLDIQLNTLDRPGRGLGGMYLTVLGTSVESGDSSQVGRGNRVNGVIGLNRPMSTEAAAGKNPVSHVGKIYTLLSHHIAQRIYTALDPVEEVYVWLCSQIGQPVAQPWITSAHVTLAPGVALGDVERAITEIIEGEFADLPAFVAQLVRGAFPIC